MVFAVENLEIVFVRIPELRQLKELKKAFFPPFSKRQKLNYIHFTPFQVRREGDEDEAKARRSGLAGRHTFSRDAAIWSHSTLERAFQDCILIAEEETVFLLALLEDPL